MYSYDLDDIESKSDLKRLQATGKYRIACEWTLEDAHNITAMSNLNSVNSPLIFCATSDRCVMRTNFATHSKYIISLESCRF
jgi:hypothetical protein